MLYRSTDRLSRRGAPVQNLAHSASFESLDKDAPSKAGTKHLGGVILAGTSEGMRCAPERDGPRMALRRSRTGRFDLGEAFWPSDGWSGHRGAPLGQRGGDGWQTAVMQMPIMR